MKTISAFEAKTHMGKLLDRVAGGEEIVITRHGKPAGILVGFASEDDWFELQTGA